MERQKARLAVGLVGFSAILGPLSVGQCAEPKPSEPGAPSWTFGTQKGGVTVFFRPKPDSKVYEVRGEAILPLAAETLFAVLADIDAYAEIMPPTVISKRLAETDHGRSYYIEIDPPVVSRRYYCMDVAFFRPSSDEFVSQWQMWPTGCSPRKNGLVPMTDNRGHWHLSSLGPQTTKVVFEAHLDPGGHLPSWIVNRATLGQVAQTFFSLHKAALKR